MYLLLLFLTACLIFSLLTTRWPVKLYHHYLMKKLGAVLNCEPRRSSLILSGVYSQIDTVYKGRQLQIRFGEGAVGALKNNAGLEIRLKVISPVVLGIYHRKHGQQEWGDFKCFSTGEPEIDSKWTILTNNPPAAAEFWRSGKLVDLLTGTGNNLEQIQVNHDQIIVCLRRFHSASKVAAFIDRLNESIPADIHGV